MAIAWGIVLIISSALAWGGQVLSWLAPTTAVRLSVMEAQDTVEPTFWADIRAEAAWDSFTLWTMTVAGVLLVADRPSWAYFGLVGGGIYVYFAGRGIAARLSMRRRGLRIGTADSVRAGLVALGAWGAIAAITIVAAVIALPIS